MDLLRRLQTECFAHLAHVPKNDAAARIEGWMPAEFLTHFETALRTSGCLDRRSARVLEVGSWKGLSANAMARACKQHGMSASDIAVVCIDTWLGSPEHMEGESSSATMRRVHGIPLLFNEFCENTNAHGNDDVIYPFPISSAQGAHYLQSKRFTCDIMYIDAGHDYETVSLDLKLLWPLLADGGVLIMDDWRWPGVRRAVEEFVKRESACERFHEGDLQVYLVKRGKSPGNVSEASSLQKLRTPIIL